MITLGTKIYAKFGRLDPGGRNGEYFELEGIVVRMNAYNDCQVNIVVERIVRQRSENIDRFKHVGELLSISFFYCLEIEQVALEELFTHDSEHVRGIAYRVQQERERCEQEQSV